MSVLGLLLVAAQPSSDPPLDVLGVPMSIEVRQDPITDRISAFAVARTDGARLAIGCDPQRWRGLRVVLDPTRAYLPNEPLLSGAHRFPYRFGKTRPRSPRWSGNGNEAFLKGRRETASFVRQALAAPRVAVQIRDVEERTLSFIFSLTGSRTVLPEVLRLCGRPRR